MSEQIAGGGTQTAAPAPQDGQGQPTSGQPAAGKTFTQEELDRIISERLQREREKYKDYDALKQKAAEFDKLQESQLSEQEKLQKRLAELEREKESWQRERQERTLKYETMLTASRLGIVDPEAAYRLLDLSKLEFAEDGTPKNLEQALKELIKAKPYLAGAPAVTGGSPANPATGQQRGGTFTLSQINDYRFWQQHRDEILQAMAEGRIIPG
jgi:hypothetical protein